MRFLILSLLLISPIVCTAQDKPAPAEPKDLTEARKQYESGVALAQRAHETTLETLAKKYREKLEELKVERTKKGDLDGAIAVKKEGERVAQSDMKIDGKWLPVGKWTWGNAEYIILTRDGYANVHSWEQAGLITRWRVIGPRTILLFTEKGRDNNKMAIMMFNEAGTAWTGLNFDQSPLSGASAR